MLFAHAKLFQMNTFNVYEHSFILFHIYNVYNEIILANQLYVYQMDIFFFLIVTFIFIK